MANGSDHWFQRKHADALAGPIAYFCAEYGLHESLGIYSGGLGVLAGDHMKAASDMALPLVGVGLLYRKGYFRQTIDADGHQEHAYPDYDLSPPAAAAASRTRTGAADGHRRAARPRRSQVAVWLAQVGRVPVLLLDTDIPENDPSRTGRSRTSCTSAAARCGSTRSSSSASAACARSGPSGIDPGGLAPQRGPLGVPARRARARARRRPARRSTTPGRRSRRNSVFTIHTPVSAGNERFDARSRPARRRPAARRRRRPDRPGPRARASARTATAASST